MAHCTHGCVMNVINLGNSIIGVSILAMPYCFRKCGIFLSFLLIVISGILVKSACYLLLKAAIRARRRNFEFLAFHILGSSGKLMVEIGIIGFLIGVCIALFVVIGDLGPPLASEYLMVDNTSNLRIKILVCLGLFVALPLGLLRKVDSLTSLSALSIGFYGFLVVKIISEAGPKLALNEWWYEVNWWQPDGILPCLPIFSMALSCQTQLFEFFDTLNDTSLKRMTTIVDGAVHLCSSVYVLVGLFGYIAFCDKAVTGNVLLWLTPSLMTELIKIGFIVTVVISFPLCLFPCRTSLHSLLFKQGVSHHDMSMNFIPNQRFNALTVSLVTATVSISIMLPNIEFVLGLIGSTIGTTICFILPALLFIRDTNKNSSEKRKAQVVFIIGVFILVACTYYTLRKNNKPHVHLVESIDVNAGRTEQAVSSLNPILSQIPPLLLEISKESSVKDVEGKGPENLKKENTINEDGKPGKEGDQKRQEPPIPQEPETKIVKGEPSADLDPQALQKEDKELQKDAQKEMPTAKVPTEMKNDLYKQEQLLRKLEAHQQEQKLLIEEQKKVLAELKLHKETHNEVKKTEVTSRYAKEVLGVKMQEHSEKSLNMVNVPNSSVMNVKHPAVIHNDTSKQHLDALKPDQNIKQKDFDVPINLLVKENKKGATRPNFRNLTHKKQLLENEFNKQNFKIIKKDMPYNQVNIPEKNIHVFPEENVKAKSNETQHPNINAQDKLEVADDHVNSIVIKNQNFESGPLQQEKILEKPSKTNQPKVVIMKAYKETMEEALPHVVKREANMRRIDSSIPLIMDKTTHDNASVIAIETISSSSTSDVSYDKEKREMRKLLYWNPTQRLRQHSNVNIT